MVSKTRLTDGKEVIEVHLEGVEGIRQPEDFIFCPFGVQLYSNQSVEPHIPVELSIRVSNGSGEPISYTCLGVTIDSARARDDTLFRTFVKFLHVPDDLYPHINCNGPGEADLCDFCDGELSAEYRRKSGS